MASSRAEGPRRGAALRAKRVAEALGAVLFAFLATPAVFGAELSEADTQCLSCHSVEGLKKDLGKGKTLALHVRGDDFARSVHQPIGCAACHADVKPDKHPPGRKGIKNAREYSIALVEVCRQCHEDKFKQYEGSIHAAQLREGNRAAPVCTDCHGAHTVTKGAYETLAGVPCKTCHDAVFKAYAGSMHGKARSRHLEAPICADCHRAHDVSAVSLGDRLRQACLKCHEGAPLAHDKWLPNAGRHLQAVSCAACHAPAAQRRVDLRLYTDREGVERFAARSGGAQGGSLDAMALWSLLREANREGKSATLRGRLVVRTGAEAHQLADKSKALRDCDSCHRAGADPFQTVTVSIAGPDGKPVRLGADKEVLSSVISVDSVSGFYAIGGTRIKLLDVLLALALLGGISVPLVHLLVRRLFKKYAKHGASESAADERK